jgi:hypothetical protein
MTTTVHPLLVRRMCVRAAAGRTARACGASGHTNARNPNADARTHCAAHRRAQLALHDAAWAPLDAPPQREGGAGAARGQRHGTPSRVQEPRGAFRSTPPARPSPSQQAPVFQRLSQPRPARTAAPPPRERAELSERTLALAQQHRERAAAVRPTSAPAQQPGRPLRSQTRSTTPTAGRSAWVQPGAPAASLSARKLAAVAPATHTRPVTPARPASAGGASPAARGAALSAPRTTQQPFGARARAPPPPRPRTAPGERRGTLDGGASWGSAASARSTSGAASLTADTQRRVDRHVERMEGARLAREARARAAAGADGSRWTPAPTKATEFGFMQRARAAPATERR